MADHDKPTATSNYLDFVSEMHGRMDDLAVGLDPERTSATNVPNYSIRWSSAAKKWQYLDGSSWKDLTSEYAINIAGHAEKLKTPRTIQITGGGLSDAVAFDGTKNIEIPLNSLDLDELEGLGSAAGADVVQSTGNSEDDVMSQKAVTKVFDDLGTAAFKNIGTSTGNVMEVGAFGLGSESRGILLGGNVDLNDYTITGFYSQPTNNGASNGANYPTHQAGCLFVYPTAGNNGVGQTYYTYLGSMFIRTLEDERWSDWKEIHHAGSFPPIGFCYTQYPGTDTPSSLFGGTWTLMFNTEGVFFRTEGQGASSFGGGIQSDQFRSHTHTARGTISAPGGFGGGSSGYWSGNVTTSSAGGSETRPRNRTVRVWRKTAH